MLVQFGSRALDLDRPRVMGILNVTPDSFYDGGRLYGHAGVDIGKAIRAAEKMVSDGAAFIDIGGESTRPGAEPVSPQQECDRVLPVVEALAGTVDAIISVDTSSPEVMTEAYRLGAGLINDVRALEKEGALAAAVATGLPVCLMHMRGTPRTMQEKPEYDDIVRSVADYLAERTARFIAAGGAPDKIIVDPGFGFGKTDEHNLALLKALRSFADSSPLLVGLSRKSLLGRILGRAPDERLPGSLALAMVALQNGANILRVHDVAETVDVVKIFEFARG